MLAKLGTLAMWVAVGLTGYTGPWNPPNTRLRTSSWPTVPGEREAPITATERGRSNLCMERAAALRSRSCSAPNASWVTGGGLLTTSISAGPRPVLDQSFPPDWGDRHPIMLPSPGRAGPGPGTPGARPLASTQPNVARIEPQTQPAERAHGPSRCRRAHTGDLLLLSARRSRGSNEKGTNVAANELTEAFPVGGERRQLTTGRSGACPRSPRVLGRSRRAK